MPISSPDSSELSTERVISMKLHRIELQSAEYNRQLCMVREGGSRGKIFVAIFHAISCGVNYQLWYKSLSAAGGIARSSCSSEVGESKRFECFKQFRNWNHDIVRRAVRWCRVRSKLHRSAGRCFDLIWQWSAVQHWNQFWGRFRTKT